MTKNVSGTPQVSAHLDMSQLVQRGNALHDKAVFAMLTGAMAWCKAFLRRGESARRKDVSTSQGCTRSSFSDRVNFEVTQGQKGPQSANVRKI